MAIDIVPELLDDIQRDFNKEFNNSKKLQEIRQMIDGGVATYEQANEYAIEVGEILAKAFKKNLRADVLPDGRMYYNIAERILNPTLGNNHRLVSEASAEIQEILNQSVGLGIKGIEAPVNQYRIDSIINRVSVEEEFENVSWILQEPIVNFSQSTVDDVIKTNVDFHGESGLSPTVVRKAHGHDPCDWCRAMEGTYKYPDVPDGVYGRHDRCRCTVEYDPGDSRRQNVWTKEWSG